MEDDGHLLYFIVIWYFLWLFGIFCGNLVYFVVTWYIFPNFGILCQEKSGNPEVDCVWQFHICVGIKDPSVC
jgi:hypothetical protein